MKMNYVLKSLVGFTCVRIIGLQRFQCTLLNSSGFLLND